MNELIARVFSFGTANAKLSEILYRPYRRMSVYVIRSWRRGEIFIFSSSPFPRSPGVYPRELRFNISRVLSRVLPPQPRGIPRRESKNNRRFFPPSRDSPKDSGEIFFCFPWPFLTGRAIRSGRARNELYPLFPSFRFRAEDEERVAATL